MEQVFVILLWTTAIIFVLIGFDDLMIDLTFWFNRKKYYESLPDISNMHESPEKPIAIIIGAWREFRVIGRTLSYALKNLKYKNFKIFIAVYPNDYETIDEIKRVAQDDNRVIICVNSTPGPTTKADNLNNAYKLIKEYETINEEFDIIIIHDAEDFIHPLSLRLYNHTIMYSGYDAIQIPVIPIKGDGGIIHRTYCDSFAEFQTKDTIVRQSLGVFVPFAGTGMAFNRSIFKQLSTHFDNLFNADNLTEDYELGLRLKRLGYKTAFISTSATGSRDINSRIATGEYFPDGFMAAVKQRSRWLAGICLQNSRIHKWHGDFKTRYFMFRDRKSIFCNFLTVLSVIVFTIFLVILFAPHFGYKFINPEVVKHKTYLWWFLLTSFIFMLNRLIHRFIFTWSWYGLQYAFVSIMRTNVDNVINFFASIRAFKVFHQVKDKVVWDSTEHY